MRKILSITFLLLVFSLAGCGKSSVLPDINQKNCENNPKLLDSLEEQTKVDFQRRCIMFKTWGKDEKPQHIIHNRPTY